MNNFSRRQFVATGVAMGAAMFAPLPALALTDAQAKTLVDSLVADINKVIASGKPLSGMITEFERIFRKYADVNIIAQSTLGPAAKTATPAQMKNFTNAFTGYIARKYGKRFNEFVGGKIEVKGVRAVKSWQEVKSMVYLKGEQPFEVAFLVSDRSGKNLFFDMIMEGISMRLSERTEISAMLDRNKGNLDATIAELKKAG